MTYPEPEAYEEARKSDRDALAAVGHVLKFVFDRLLGAPCMLLCVTILLACVGLVLVGIVLAAVAVLIAILPAAMLLAFCAPSVMKEYAKKFEDKLGEKPRDND